MRIMLGGQPFEGEYKDSYWKEYIETKPEILRGKSRIKGTRIPVSLILGYFAAGKTADEIISEFEDLNKKNIKVLFPCKSKIFQRSSLK